MADSPATRIELLGGFRVTVGTHMVPTAAWRRSKAAGLVKLLALAPGHRLHREQAMDIQMAAACMAAGMPIEEIAALQFAFLTFTEGVSQAAQMLASAPGF